MRTRTDQVSSPRLAALPCPAADPVPAGLQRRDAARRQARQPGSALVHRERRELRGGSPPRGGDPGIARSRTPSPQFLRIRGRRRAPRTVPRVLRRRDAPARRGGVRGGHRLHRLPLRRPPRRPRPAGRAPDEGPDRVRAAPEAAGRDDPVAAVVQAVVARGSLGGTRAAPRLGETPPASGPEAARPRPMTARRAARQAGTGGGAPGSGLPPEPAPGGSGGIGERSRARCRGDACGGPRLGAGAGPCRRARGDRRGRIGDAGDAGARPAAISAGAARPQPRARDPERPEPPESEQGSPAGECNSRRFNQRHLPWNSLQACSGISLEVRVPFPSSHRPRKFNSIFLPCGALDTASMITNSHGHRFIYIEISRCAITTLGDHFGKAAWQLPQRQIQAPAAIPRRVLLSVQPAILTPRDVSPARQCRPAHSARARPCAQAG